MAMKMWPLKRVLPESVRLKKLHLKVFNNIHHTSGIVVSGRIKQESQGSRTTLSATRQEVPKNIQKPYTLVTFDEMHQKDLCGWCQVSSGQAERIRLSPRSSMKKY